MLKNVFTWKSRKIIKLVADLALKKQAKKHQTTILIRKTISIEIYVLLFQLNPLHEWHIKCSFYIKSKQTYVCHKILKTRLETEQSFRGFEQPVGPV